jgi:hypothetical protein
MRTMRRAIAGMLIGLVSVACSTADSDSRTTPSPATTSCPAPALAPGYLPDGVRSVEKGPLVGIPDRTRTWAKDGVVVQLDEGFSGDHGDEPRLEQVTVRGDRFAHLLTDDYSDGTLVTVDWAEETRCGHKQYVVVTKGLSEDETLKIAQSLEGKTSG